VVEEINDVLRTPYAKNISLATYAMNARMGMDLPAGKSFVIENHRLSPHGQT
jgi:hypothetical protein